MSSPISRKEPRSPAERLGMILGGLSVVAVWTWAWWPLPQHAGIAEQPHASSPTLPAASAPAYAWSLPGWTAAPPVVEAAAPSAHLVLVSVFQVGGKQTAALDLGDGQGLVYAEVGQQVSVGTVTEITATRVVLRTAAGLQTLTMVAP